MLFQVRFIFDILVSEESLRTYSVSTFDALKLYHISGIQNVAFFFSAISSQENKSGCITEDTDDESSSGDEIPSSITQQWLEGNLTNVNKSLCPAISYWVALTTTNGAPASPILVHKVLLNCGLDVTATQVTTLLSLLIFFFANQLPILTSSKPSLSPNNIVENRGR